MSNIHQEKLEELRAEHGNVSGWVVDGVLVAVAAPKAALDYDQFVDEVSKDGGKTSEATRRFALACVVHPALPDAKKLLLKYPALANKLASAAQKFAGSSFEELAGN